MKDPNQRAEEIFPGAIKIADATARLAYLERSCLGDDALRQEVESLPKAHFAAGDFLGKTMVLPRVQVGNERPGTRIGRYKLLEKIGEGGFGDSANGRRWNSVTPRNFSSWAICELTAGCWMP